MRTEPISPRTAAPRQRRPWSRRSPRSSTPWICPTSPCPVSAEASPQGCGPRPPPRTSRGPALSPSGSASPRSSRPAARCCSSSARRTPTPGCCPRTTRASRPGWRRWWGTPSRSRSLRRRARRCAGRRRSRRTAEPGPGCQRWRRAGRRGGRSRCAGGEPCWSGLRLCSGRDPSSLV